jgi:hypothetical protein
VRTVLEGTVSPLGATGLGATDQLWSPVYRATFLPQSLTIFWGVRWGPCTPLFPLGLPAYLAGTGHEHCQSQFPIGLWLVLPVGGSPGFPKPCPDPREVRVHSKYCALRTMLSIELCLAVIPLYSMRWCLYSAGMPFSSLHLCYNLVDCHLFFTPYFPLLFAAYLLFGLLLPLSCLPQACLVVLWLALSYLDCSDTPWLMLTQLLFIFSSWLTLTHVEPSRLTLLHFTYISTPCFIPFFSPLFHLSCFTFYCTTFLMFQVYLVSNPQLYINLYFYDSWALSLTWFSIQALLLPPHSGVSTPPSVSELFPLALTHFPCCP